MIKSYVRYLSHFCFQTCWVRLLRCFVPVYFQNYVLCCSFCYSAEKVSQVLILALLCQHGHAPVGGAVHLRPGAPGNAAGAAAAKSSEGSLMLLAAFGVECVFLCVAFLALTSGPPYKAGTDGLRTRRGGAARGESVWGTRPGARPAGPRVRLSPAAPSAPACFFCRALDSACYVGPFHHGSPSPECQFYQGEDEVLFPAVPQVSRVMPGTLKRGFQSTPVE